MPFQRRHAFAGRHVPHLERRHALSPTQTRRAARPETWQRYTTSSRNGQIITKVQRTPQRTYLRVPFQRRHAFAGRHVPDLERPVVRPRHDAPPVRKHAATPITYDEARSSQKYSGRRATHGVLSSSALPASPRISGRDVPHLERVVARRHTTRRPSGNTATLKTYDEATSSQKYSGRRNARCAECPSSVATGNTATLYDDVATPHTLSVLSPDPDTTRRPSGNTATPRTYDEHTSSQKYSGRRNARDPSALPASPRICRSPRPTP